MDTATTKAVRAAPWNKGKLVGQKPPLKLKEIWAIRIRLQLDHRARELALFKLAIDNKLRGCDLIGLHVHDVVQGSHVAARAIVMQKKTDALLRTPDWRLPRRHPLRPTHCEATRSFGARRAAWMRATSPRSRPTTAAGSTALPCRMRCAPVGDRPAVRAMSHALRFVPRRAPRRGDRTCTADPLPERGRPRFLPR